MKALRLTLFTPNPALHTMRLVRVLSVAVAALLGLCCGSSPAQQVRPSAPTLTVQSQLVVLDAVVTDHDGRVPTGLAAKDFAVYENNIRQTLRYFSASDAAAVPRAPLRDRNGHDDWGASPLLMIVVDELNTPFNEAAYVRDCVRNFLRRQTALLLQPTILLSLDDAGVHALTPFTRDRDAVLSALQHLPPSLPSKLMRGAQAEQVAESLAALQQAALFSRGLAGRKQILWLGRSFPSIDPIRLTDFHRSLLRRAVRSTVDFLLASRATLYVIDPTVTGSAREDDSGIAQDVDTLQLETAGTAKDPFASSFNLNLFVNETGGKYLRGRNDLEAEIDRSQQRALTSYTLSYVPAQRVQEGSYHKIDVRVLRPGFSVQTKKGYFAEDTAGEPGAGPPLEAALSDKQLRFDLYEALVTGMQYIGVGLHADACSYDSTPGGVHCTLSVDTGSLTFTQHPAARDERSTVLVVAASLDAHGKLISNTASRMTVSIPEAQVSGIAAGFIRMQMHTVVAPTAASLRIALRDASGRIGTVDVPLFSLAGKPVASPRKNP